MSEKLLANEKILDSHLLVIDEKGNNLGRLSKDEALKLAKLKDLDLVLFVPSSKNNNLPIAKIINFGKYVYDQKIKQKQSKKNQTVIKVKEIKVRPQTGSHDLAWRAKNALNWINDNCQVKFKILAYGRVGYKPELIQETYDKFIKLLEDKVKIIYPLKKISPVLYECTLGKK